MSIGGLRTPVAGAQIIMLDHAALDYSAALYADLRSRGQLIEDVDQLSGAIALVHNLILVTHNTTHFERIEGLHIKDWLTS